MIPNQWYTILESKEVRPNRPVGVKRLGEQLVLWRNARGEVSCLSDQCPHRGAALSAGKIKSDCVECPFHGFQFDATGRCRLIPANGKNTPVPKVFQTRSYPIREAHGFIWLWWGEPRAALPPLPFFDDIDASFSGIGYSDHWAVHYSRAIENQLDVVHLPFVHVNTIGRGGRTLVDGPVAELSEDKMQIWVYNRMDDGTPPRKPAEIAGPRASFFLRFHFPNLWENHISDDMRIVVAFVPIDDENCRLYLRFYQRFVRVPVLRWLVDLSSLVSGWIILNEDKRVVLTQRPKKTDLKMGEHLIQGDHPIILYRRRRRELIDAAQAT